MDLHLRGKRVLITGASKGIGAAAAEAFAEEGCHLLLAARSGDQLKTLTERLRSAHQIDASAHIVDLRKPEDLAKLARDAADVDILVNNAGDIPGGSIDQIDEPAWRHAWELKVFGYINLTRAIYAQMKARGHGVIVNDIGAAGEKFDANYICGSAGNAALMAFTRALGGKSLADNIRVVGINPGPVGTDRHVTLLKTRAKHQFGDDSRSFEAVASATAPQDDGEDAATLLRPRQLPPAGADAAVNRVNHARRVAGAVGGEERHQVADFAGMRGTAERQAFLLAACAESSFEARRRGSHLRMTTA